jgi:hypothetical protein
MWMSPSFCLCIPFWHSGGEISFVCFPALFVDFVHSVLVGGLK